MRELRYSTRSGIAVTRTVSKISFKKGTKDLLKDLVYTSQRLLFPPDTIFGRYSTLGVAATAPQLQIIAASIATLNFKPLNPRQMLTQMLYPILAKHPHWGMLLPAKYWRFPVGRCLPLPKLFAEEERSKQPFRVFAILRALIRVSKAPEIRCWR